MKASVFIATTVDGFIADDHGSVDFLNDYPPMDGNDFGFGAFLASVNVLVMGRRTFDTVVGFGPDQWAYGDTPVVVLSRGAVEIPEHLQATVTSSSLSPKDLLDELESQGHQHAYIDGGLTIQRFLQDDLIDTFILTRVPLLLGSGRALFGNGPRLALEHVATEAFANGLVSTTYRRVRNSEESTTTQA